MFQDATYFPYVESVQIWEPSRESFKLTIKDLKAILHQIPDHYHLHIDDYDFICYEVEPENEAINFWRDYKGD